MVVDSKSTFVPDRFLFSLGEGFLDLHIGDSSRGAASGRRAPGLRYEDRLRRWAHSFEEHAGTDPLKLLGTRLLLCWGGRRSGGVDMVAGDLAAIFAGRAARECQV